MPVQNHSWNQDPSSAPPRSEEDLTRQMDLKGTQEQLWSRSSPDQVWVWSRSGLLMVLLVWLV